MQTQKKRAIKSQSMHRQRGVALIIALMITAIVAALSVKASWEFELSHSRSANAWFTAQQEISLIALEDAAKYFLTLDLQNENSVNDTVDEINLLNSQLQFEPSEGVLLSGLVEDAHARFNINNLQKKIESVPQGGTTADNFTTAQKRFIRLLQTIPIEDELFLQEFEATSITEAIIDWLDPDSTPTGFEGAEGDYYSSLEPPIMIANRKMISVSELRVIKGMTPILYRALIPYVIALQEETAMNINTMPLELMRMFNQKDNLQPQPLSVLEDFILEREVNSFENVEDFSALPSIEAMVGTTEEGAVNLDVSQLGVKSTYFLLFGQVQTGDAIGRSKVLLKRSDQGTTVLRRTDANF